MLRGTSDVSEFAVPLAEAGLGAGREIRMFDRSYGRSKSV